MIGTENNDNAVVVHPEGKITAANANDFRGFLRNHPDVRLIAFNGKKAEQLFRRFVPIDGLSADVSLTGLPSTSPAYASMSFSGKLAAWRAALEDDREPGGDGNDRIRNAWK